MRIHFALEQAVGGGNLRAVWPAQALAEAGHEATHGIGSEVPDCDVLIVHRPLAPGRLMQVIEAKRRGIRVLVDEDDALDLAADAGNEIARRHWSEEVRRLHDDTLSAADAVTVSTAPLARHYVGLNPNITVVRNRLPRRFLTLRPQRIDPPLVGWFGIVDSHRHDLRWLRPAMPFLRPEFETMGDYSTPVVVGRPGSRVHEFTFDSNLLYSTIARWSVGLVPLTDHPFNHSKSWLKALEYMTQGVIPVARRLPEQELLIHDGIDGFLVDIPEAMIDHANRLAADHDLRRQMRNAAKDRAAEESIENHVGDWEIALRP